MTTPIIIKNATASDEASIIDLLVRAFNMDPAALGEILLSSKAINSL